MTRAPVRRPRSALHGSRFFTAVVVLLMNPLTPRLRSVEPWTLDPWTLGPKRLLAQEIPLGTRVGLPPSGYQAVGRRDPFASLIVAPSTAAPVPVQTRRASGLAGQSAADLVLKGIITAGSTRIALLEGVDGKTYLARTRDRLQDGIVQRIEEDAVVIVVTARSKTNPAGEVRKALRPTDAGGGE